MLRVPEHPPTAGISLPSVRLSRCCGHRGRSSVQAPSWRHDPFALHPGIMSTVPYIVTLTPNHPGVRHRGLHDCGRCGRRIGSADAEKHFGGSRRSDRSRRRKQQRRRHSQCQCGQATHHRLHFRLLRSRLSVAACAASVAVTLRQNLCFGAQSAVAVSGTNGLTTFCRAGFSPQRAGMPAVQGGTRRAGTERRTVFFLFHRIWSRAVTSRNMVWNRQGQKRAGLERC